ncbi:uncharacterized protein [Parasteatoda tepidariorum]|uniref:uncharacterized protein n=1 Tax=Parasteatoda tepidariorum TaxID=114398 RepID=UPI001C72815E|nr:uncharacterized protein LOC107437383 [Parasteatoda tepidariorum]
MRRCVQLSLSSLWNKNSVSITAFESSNRYTSHPVAPADVLRFARSRKLTLADPPGDDNLPIELLIGGDYYWHMVTTEPPIKVTESVGIVPSIFGWILNRSRTHTTIKHDSSVRHVSVQISGDCLHDEVRCLWELDCIGIKDTQIRNKTVRENDIMREFHETYQTEGNRRVVSLPRKSTKSILSTNIATTEKRLKSFQKRLASNDAVKKEYDSCMLNYIEEGHVEVYELEPSNLNTVFYPPHHAVKKVKLNETKWRIVFDALLHDPGMPSLNDTLEIGPNLLPETIGCLLRLRMHKFVVTGDGKKSFLQLSLHERNRDSTRFFWYRLSQDKANPSFTDEIITYRFTRLPFGLACSPFLLCAATREVASKHVHEFPIAAPMIDKHLYMDDFVASAETESEIATLHKEVKELMQLIEIPMEKWATNSPMLQSQLRDQDEGFKTTVKVLGIEWNTENDTLGNTFKTSLCAVQDKPLTKRWLLHCIASFYDPLGLFSPFVIFGKILFQDIWILGIKWDEILPSNLATSWNAAVGELDDVSSFQIPRFIGVSSHVPFTIHVFCHASKRAYEAVLYIVSSQGDQANVHLVCSRNRLAPIKKVTLLRLELLAALMGA